MVLRFLQWCVLVPAIAGSVYAVLCVLTALRLRSSRRRGAPKWDRWPQVSVLKPVHGLEKNLPQNLRSACIQDYPDYQVVFSVQAPDDPAIPLLRELQAEFGAGRVTVAVESFSAGPNGKINNLIGALRHARHDMLVISDSDIRLQPDYLKTIIAPLADPRVGCVCTLYKGACASTWFEKLELLTLNADYMGHVIFALVTKASKFCLGASTALRRRTLDQIGGIESLADYLVEDFEMGRRIWSSGKEVVILPYFVETMVDLKSARQYWNHQVYWDQNHRSARPIGYLATAIIRSTPFALLYLLLRPGMTGLAVLAGAVAMRTLSAAFILRFALRDLEGLRSIGLLFFRDVAALVSWVLAFTKRTTIWRGSKFVLTRDGRLVAREARS